MFGDDVQDTYGAWDAKAGSYLNIIPFKLLTNQDQISQAERKKGDERKKGEGGGFTRANLPKPLIDEAAFTFIYVVMKIRYIFGICIKVNNFSFMCKTNKKVIKFENCFQ